MNTLTREQLKSITKYWRNRRSLEHKLMMINLRMETIFAYGTESDNIEEMIDEVEGEIRQMNVKIQKLDEEYEVMLNGHGIRLYDRSMEEDLFAFINDGPE
jgi:hypothetical protein